MENNTPICENIHELTNPGHLKLCQDLLFKSDYYWEGYSKTMKGVIKNCKVCSMSKKNINQILIIENEPHFRYVADIWELDKKVSDQTGMKYILEIIDHFSK